MLFRTSRREELSDEETAAIFERLLEGTGRLPRHVDLLLTTLSVQYLVRGLRAAGVALVARKGP